MTFWTNVRNFLAGRRAVEIRPVWQCYGCKKDKIGRPILQDGKLYCSYPCLQTNPEAPRLYGDPR